MGLDKFRLRIVYDSNGESKEIFLYYETFTELNIAYQVIYKGLCLRKEFHFDEYTDGSWKEMRDYLS